MREKWRHDRETWLLPQRTWGRSENMTGRLDFSLREHEGKVKTWQGDLTSPSDNMREKWKHDRETWLLPQRTGGRSEDFQQLHRDMFPQKCVVSPHHLKKQLHLKCAFANILLISFIFNIKFMFCTCIIVVNLIFVNFRFYSFRIEIYKIYISSVLMRFLCKTSHKDSCAWPCLTWHCQPIKSAEYNQWSPLLRLL